MIGRFNSWKGQGLLVRAMTEIGSEMQDRVAIKMVGGVYKDQYHFREDVIVQVKECRA